MARSTSSHRGVPGTSITDGTGALDSPSTCSSRCVPASGRRTCWSSPACCSATQLFDPAAVVARGRGVRRSSARCPASSTSINDIADRESDRQHPLKARRPIASGALPVPTAIGGGGRDRRRRARRRASLLGLRFAAVAVAYLALQVLYSGPLKHIVIIDVLTIAIGFVLRAVGGRGRGRRRDQPLAARLHDPAGAVHGAGEAAARDRAARRRRDEPPADSRRVQPVSARSDDRRRHRVDADRVHLLHDQPRDAGRSSARRGSG